MSGQEARIVQIDFVAAFDIVTTKEFSIGSALWLLEAKYIEYSKGWAAYILTTNENSL